MAGGPRDLAELLAGAAGPRDLAELVALAAGLHDLAELVALAAGLHDLAELVALAAGLHDLAELVAVAAGLHDLAELVAVAAGLHDLAELLAGACPPCQNSHRCAKRWIDPLPLPGAPARLAQLLRLGAHGACMTTSDQSQSATLEGLRATLDKRRLPGPRDAEVRSLSALVDQLEILLGSEPLEARRVAVDMLSGAVGSGFDWQGSPAHQLPLFQRTRLGTYEVSSEVPRLEDGDGVTVYPSERQRALAKFLEGEPMPWLVVRYADALEALGINELRCSLPPPPAKEEAKGSASSQGLGGGGAAPGEPETNEQPPQEFGKLIALKSWKDIKAEGERLAATFKRPKNKVDKWTVRSIEELRRQITELIGLGVQVSAACIMVANAWNAGLAADDPERVEHESIATHWRRSVKRLEALKRSNKEKRRA